MVLSNAGPKAPKSLQTSPLIPECNEMILFTTDDCKGLKDRGKRGAIRPANTLNQKEDLFSKPMIVSVLSTRSPRHGMSQSITPALGETTYSLVKGVEEMVRSKG